MDSATQQLSNSATHIFNQSIFREYDIRGTYNENLFDADAYQLGLNYAATLGKGRVAVGYDGRVSSPALYSALANGLTDGGLDVVNVGLVPTPVAYFAVFHLDLDGCIMITGSHNPPDQNGFKIMVGKEASMARQSALCARLKVKGQRLKVKLKMLI